jgi:hypothetical protein
LLLTEDDPEEIILSYKVENNFNVSMVLFYKNFNISKDEENLLDDSCYESVVLKPGFSFIV